MKKAFSFLVFFLWAAQGLAAKGCPDPSKLKEALRGLFTNPNFEIISLKEAPVAGLCEVIIKTPGAKRLAYVDASGKYLVVGRIIDIKARKDLTQERVIELNRLKPESLRELEKVVAFSVGKGKEVYFVTDPDCPHCKQAEKILFPLVREGKIKLKVILFPLEALHPEAKKKAISIICERKFDLESLIKGYQGQECPEGRKKVEAALALLPKLGIRATPTYIFPDGRVISGVLSAPKLLEMVRENGKGNRS